MDEFLFEIIIFSLTLILFIGILRCSLKTFFTYMYTNNIEEKAHGIIGIVTGCIGAVVAQYGMFSALDAIL